MPHPGGRPKGSLNKNKQGLLARLRREFPGYHPVVEMARIANDLNNPVELRGQMHGQVAKYVAPVLKAVDFTGLEGGPVEVVVRLSPIDVVDFMPAEP